MNNQTQDTVNRIQLIKMLKEYGYDNVHMYNLVEIVKNLLEEKEKTRMRLNSFLILLISLLVFVLLLVKL